MGLSTEGAMTLTHQAAKGGYSWVRNQVVALSRLYYTVRPEGQYIQFLGYIASSCGLHQSMLSTRITIICVTFSGIVVMTFRNLGHQSITSLVLAVIGSWKRAAMVKTHGSGMLFMKRMLWNPQSQRLAREKCMLERGPMNPWHFALILSNPTSQPHIFRIVLAKIWTRITAAPWGPRPIMETSQQCLHLRTSRRVPHCNSRLKARWCYLFLCWIQLPVLQCRGRTRSILHRPNAKFHTARTLSMFTRAGDWGTPLRPIFFFLPDKKSSPSIANASSAGVEKCCNLSEFNALLTIC